MKISHLIVRSLSIYNSFTDLVFQNGVDVFIITETCLNINIQSGTVTLPGYCFLSKQDGGGVTVYVRNTLNCSEFICNISVTGHMEYVISSLKIGVCVFIVTPTSVSGETY